MTLGHLCVLELVRDRLAGPLLSSLKERCLLAIPPPLATREQHITPIALLGRRCYPPLDPRYAFRPMLLPWNRSEPTICSHLHAAGIHKLRTSGDFVMISSWLQTAYRDT